MRDCGGNCLRAKSANECLNAAGGGGEAAAKNKMKRLLQAAGGGENENQNASQKRKRPEKSQLKTQIGVDGGRRIAAGKTQGNLAASCGEAVKMQYANYQKTNKGFIDCILLLRPLAIATHKIAKNAKNACKNTRLTANKKRIQQYRRKMRFELLSSIKNKPPTARKPCERRQLSTGQVMATDLQKYLRRCHTSPLRAYRGVLKIVVCAPRRDIYILSCRHYAM